MEMKNRKLAAEIAEERMSMIGTAAVPKHG